MIDWSLSFERLLRVVLDRLIKANGYDLKLKRPFTFESQRVNERIHSMVRIIKLNGPAFNMFGLFFLTNCSVTCLWHRSRRMC